MRYWLFKSEPSCFGIDHLAKAPKQSTYWDGVRNYQVRNMLRDEIKVGDQVFFYHSNAKPPGIAGIMEVINPGYPDFTAWDKNNEHYDPDTDPNNPRWYMVDVRFKAKFENFIPLEDLKTIPALKSMLILRPGNRLSITPVTPSEWQAILKLEKK